MAKPDKLRIPHDEYRFEGVGRLPDGTQFMAFVTGAFPAGLEYYLGEDWQTRKRWFAVIHRFDADGNHIGSLSRLGGLDMVPVGLNSVQRRRRPFPVVIAKNAGSATRLVNLDQSRIDVRFLIRAIVQLSQTA
jgi:hypothetical protein